MVSVKKKEVKKTDKKVVKKSAKKDAKKVVKKAGKQSTKKIVKSVTAKSKSKNEKKDEKVKKGTANKKNTTKITKKPSSGTKKTINKEKKITKKIPPDAMIDYVEPPILEDEDEKVDEDIDFKFKGNEKDLEKEINKEDDSLILDDSDDNDDNIENEERKALQGFEQDDIFEGVPIEDPVRMYLKEIGQYDLLTPAQEQRLAKDKQDAQDLLRKKKLSEQLPIDAARTIKLNKDELKVIKKGELAQQTLINRNLRLVVSIAKRYIGHGLSLLDLIQEGNLGLTRGIEKFDYKMGFKLSTYVTWWIRQAVSRALADQSKTIRIPVHMVETINRLNKTKKKLTTKLGYEPNVKQIAKELKMSEAKVEEIMQIALDPISLDKPVGDEEDSIVADFIADQNVMSPEKYADMVLLKEQIQSLLGTLKERERKVLTLRFGIDDERQRTLEEVGRELKVTRERIRQIEDKALRKLKSKARNLQNFID